ASWFRAALWQTLGSTRTQAKTSEAHPASEADYHLEDPQSLAAFLKHADIRLVRAEYLCELRSQKKLLPRRQEAEEWGLVSHEEVSNWAAGARDAMIISISHAWETREHPDPCGDQLNRLVDRLCLYGAAYYSHIWLFYDYISLFQFERQTPAEEESFRRSMSHMHVLYAHDCNWTFRLESLTPDDVWDAALKNSEHLVTVYDATSKTVRGRPLKELVANRVPYRSRGWCKAEVEWSSCRSRSVQNQRIDAPEWQGDSDSDSERDVLRGKVAMAPEVFEADMAKAEFTHRNDATAVLKLQRKVFHQKASVCEEALLENQPKGELFQLAKALAHYKMLKVLRLRNIEVEDEDADEFAKALAQNNTITELEIKVAESGTRQCTVLCEALSKALKTNTTLTTIDLRQNTILGGSLKALAEALTTNRTLTTLKLEYQGGGYEYYMAIRRALDTRKVSTQPNPGDATSAPANGCTGKVRIEALASKLKSNRIPTKLDFADSQIGAVGGMKVLADVLKLGRSIAEIDLRNNPTYLDCQVLADALVTNSTLATIRLEHNRINAKGIKALADALRINRSLTSLNIGYNDIGDEGCKALADILKKNTNIASLSLQGNCIGDEGCKALAEAILVTNSNFATIELEYCLHGVGCKALAEALRSNPTLRAIDLDDNDIGDEGIKALAEALIANRNITEVSLQRNVFQDEGRKVLEELSKISSTLDLRWYGGTEVPAYACFNHDYLFTTPTSTCLQVFCEFANFCGRLFTAA
ncbi:NLRC3, partial [Symbiodinium sp. CCMP2456]